MLASILAALLSLAAVLGVCMVMVQVTQGVDNNGRPIYEFIHWDYPIHASFDNTWPTWSSDYLITVVMGTMAYRMHCKFRRSSSVTAQTASLAALILLMNGVSTLLGGIAHHTYSGDVSELQTSRFYIIWVGVVGLTAGVGAIQGLLAIALLRIHVPAHPMLRFLSPVYWGIWGVGLVSIVAQGWFSCSRPACDIFVAGITQAFPTFLLQYTIYVVWKEGKVVIPFTQFVQLQISLILNAPLLGLYPFFVRWFPLCITNSILHAVLLVAWAGQGYGLQQFIEKLGSSINNKTK